MPGNLNFLENFLRILSGLIVADLFCQKGAGSRYSVVYHKRSKTSKWIFLFINHFKKLVLVAPGECRKNIEKRVKE